VGDRNALAYVLLTRYQVIAGPDALDEQFEVATEALHLAEALGSQYIRWMCHDQRATVSLLRGDLPSARGNLNAYARLLVELWRLRRATRGDADAMLLLLEGRFSEAEEVAREAYATHQRIGSVNARLIYASQMFFLRRERGDPPRVHSLKRFMAEY